MYAYYVLVQRDRNTSVTKPELKKKKLTAFWEPTFQWGMHTEKLSSKYY